MRQKRLVWLLGLAAVLLPQKALAVCPICTLAVGAGVGLSRWLGVDDTVSGVWVGALVVVAALWTNNYLTGRKFGFWGSWFVWLVIYGSLVAIPLYRAEITGHPNNIFWGVDKLMLGMAVGAALTLVFSWLYTASKARNKGRAHFPFEKIVLIVVPLIIASAAFYFLTR